MNTGDTWATVGLPIAVVLIAQIGAFGVAWLTATRRIRAEDLQFIRSEVRVALARHLTASKRADRELLSVYLRNADYMRPPTAEEWDVYNQLILEHDEAEAAAFLVATDEYIEASERHVRASRAFESYITEERHSDPAPDSAALWRATQDALYEQYKQARIELRGLTAQPTKGLK